MDVREGGLGRVEAVVLDGGRRLQAQGWAEGLVVGDPGSVLLVDGRVVESARLELVDLVGGAEVRDEIDRRDGGPSGPVVRVGRKRHAGLAYGREYVAAAADEAARQEHAGLRVDARRHDRQRRAGRDSREVVGRTREVHVHLGVARGMDADGRCRAASLAVGPGAGHSVEQGRELTRMGRVQDPHPAQDYVGRLQGRPIGKLQALPKVEDDPLAVALGFPRPGKGRLHVPGRVDCRQRLEQLGDDLGATGVTLDRWVQ